MFKKFSLLVAAASAALAGAGVNFNLLRGRLQESVAPNAGYHGIGRSRYRGIGKPRPSGAKLSRKAAKGQIGIRKGW